MKLRFFLAALFLSGPASAQLVVTPVGDAIYNATFETMPVGSPLDSDHTGVANDRPNSIDNNLTAIVHDPVSAKIIGVAPTINNGRFVRLTESCGEAPTLAFDRAISLGKPDSATAIAHVAVDLFFENRENYQIAFRNGVGSGLPVPPAALALADIAFNNNGQMVFTSTGFSATWPWAVGVTTHIDVFFDTGKNLWYAFVNGERVVNGAPTIDAPVGLVSLGFQHTAFCEPPPDPGGFSGAMQFDNFVFQQVAAVPGVTPPPEIANILNGVGRPFSVATHGGYAYVADPSTHTVWKVNLTNEADKTPVAGIGWKTDIDPQDWQGFNGDGIAATEAQLDNPSGVAIDPAGGGTLYIADTGNHAVRKVSLTGAGAVISTAAGIPTTNGVTDAAAFAACQNNCQATILPLFGPRSVAVDASGHLYIADRMNQQVKRVDAVTRVITVVAGVAGETGGNDGPVAAAMLNSPVGVAVGPNIVYIADEGNNRIRFVNDGVVGTLQAGALVRPTGVVVGASGAVYIADYGNHRIVGATNCAPTCTVAPIAGTGTAGSGGTLGGPATAAQLNSPISISLDGDILYIADMVNGRIVAVDVTPTP